MKHKKLIISGLVIVAIGLLVAGGVILKNKSSNKRSVDIWHQVVLSSNTVGDFATSSVSDSNTNDLLAATVDMNSKLDDAKFKVDKLSYLVTGSDRKTSMAGCLDKIKDYNSKLKSTIDQMKSSPENVDETSLENLKTLSEDMKKLVDDTISQINFSENLNQEYYQSYDYTNKMNAAIKGVQSEEEAKKQAEADAANASKNAQAVAESFLGDYVRKDFAGMKSNMTSGFQNEFKFSEIESGWDNSHPKSYRIINTEASGSGYLISVNVTYFTSYQDQNGNPVEQENTAPEKFRVVKSDSGPYLVDGQVYN